MEHMQSLQKAKGFTANGILFFLSSAEQRTRKQQDLPQGVLLGGDEGTVLQQSQRGWSQLSPALCLPLQSVCTSAEWSSLSLPCSVLGHFQLAHLQDPEELCCIPWGISSAFHLSVLRAHGLPQHQWGQDSSHAQDKTSVLCLCCLGSKTVQQCQCNWLKRQQEADRNYYLYLWNELS